MSERSKAILGLAWILLKLLALGALGIGVLVAAGAILSLVPQCARQERIVVHHPAQVTMFEIGGIWTPIVTGTAYVSEETVCVEWERRP